MGTHVWNERGPRRWRIGARLRLCFTIIVLLMLATVAVALWQFTAARRLAERLNEVDQKLVSVLRLHADLLMLRDHLQSLVSTEDVHRFAMESAVLRIASQQEVKKVEEVLSESPVNVAHDPTMVSTLETIQGTLSAQIDALTDLARSGDWPAVHLRLENQVSPISSLSSSLVEHVDRQAAQERAAALADIQRVERRLFFLLPCTGLLTVLTAVMLGVVVTRSITQPLLELDEGAQALAREDFQHRIPTTGKDELTSLGSVFNDAASRLHNVYAALRSSEERLQTVVRTAPVGIGLLDTQCTVLLCNSAFLEILDLSEDQALGKRLGNPLREDGTVCPFEQRPSSRAMATKTPVLNVVLRHAGPDGTPGKWVLANAWPLMRADGSVYQVVLTLTDFTQQKQVEEELRSGRELIAQAQEAALLGCFDWDLLGGKIVWSPELEDLYGMTRGSFAGTYADWVATIMPEDLSALQKSLEQGRESGVVFHEFRIRRRGDREVRWITARARVISDVRGRPMRMIGVNMDVTERKRAEEALQRSAAEFRMILDNAAIGVVLVDTSGRMLRVNPAFQKMLGYSEEELADMKFRDITHPDDVAMSEELFEELLDGRRDGFQVKKRYIRKDGSQCWSRLTVSAMRQADGKFQYCVSMVEDITQQELAAQSLSQMSARVLRIQEEEQRRIAREVHDSVGQEVTALTLTLGALTKSPEPLPLQVKRMAAQSLAISKKISRQIRTFSYLLHPPMLEEFGVWTALRMFVEEFRSRSGLEVGVRIAADLEDQRLDPGCEMALFRLVQEALANVHRHSASQVASVEITQENQLIKVSVADSGRGMPAKVLAALDSGSGLVGVGIRGMKERIGQVGGHLEIHSDRGGTVVTALIPSEPPPAQIA